jgi:GH15 family glucan-1,4-alpha-glucosidase
MAWVAFDRAAHELEAQAFNEPGERWREIADEIHAEVCERGFDRDINSFVQAYGSKRLDASLLLIPLVGFLPASDPRVRGTLQAIEDKLLIEGEFVLRYDTRKFRRWPAARRRSFFGVQLLAGRQLHIARALRGSSDGFRTLARTLQ